MSGKNKQLVVVEKLRLKIWQRADRNRCAPSKFF